MSASFKPLTIGFMLFITILGLLVIELSVGAMIIKPHQLLEIILGKGDPIFRLIISSTRLPRGISAIIVGGSLAVSGVMFYYLTSNDLACPSLMGVNYGVYFAIICCYVFCSHQTVLGSFGCGLAGGLLIGFAIYCLSLRDGFSPLKLVLVGQVINLLTFASCQLLLLAFPEKTENLLINLNGSLASSSWLQLKVFGGVLAIAIMTAFILIRKNYLFFLGADMAQAVGLSTRKYLPVFALLILIITTAGVIIVGPVIFFPLLAVQISKLLVSCHKPVLFLMMSILVGALIMLGSDVLLRVIYNDWEAPLSLFVAILGVPLLIYRTRKIIK